MSNQPPECFGKQWDSAAKECSGGYDPGYVSPSGGHTRLRCDFYDSCRVRVQLAKSNQGGNNLVPPSALLARQQAQQQQAPSPWPWMPPVQQPQARAPQQQGQPAPAAPMVPMMPQMDPMQMMQMQMMMMYGGGMMPGHMPPPMPIYPGNFPIHGNIDPIKMMAMNYGMPAYLSVPEPAGGTFWGTMGREVLRGMGKALGHSIAHFFDNHAFRGR